MMLFKISLANIKKSFKDYAIYFFTLILGVVIFYVFNAIDSQAAMLKVSSNTREIIKLMTEAISYVSVFVSFVLGGLIIYASRFLIKRRNKEFGIYLTLGMSKRKISILLFLETLLIGIISLAVGLGIGVIASQLMSVIVANLFEADMTKYKFVFSQAAALKTLTYFSIMYLIVILFNTFQISRCKLINLLTGSKKGEKLRLKNPWTCTIVFILASLALYHAYDKVAFHFDALYLMRDNNFVKILLTGVVSTLLMFWSLSGLLLKIFSRIKKVYYKGLNAFTLRQFSSKINTMVVSMTVICLMLFLTICLLSSSFSLTTTLNDNLKKYTPQDMAIYKFSSEKHDDVYTELISKNYDMSKLKDMAEIHYYHDDNLTYRKTLIGKDISEGYIDEMEARGSDIRENIIPISEYNKLAKLYNQDTYDLKDNEYIVIVDLESLEEYRNEGLKRKMEVDINGYHLVPKYDKCMHGFIEMESGKTNIGIYLVPDKVVNNMEFGGSYLTFNYNTSKDEIKNEYTKELENLFKQEPGEGKIYYSYYDRIDIKESCVGLGAIITFLGLYIGVVFLISCAAILALKELSESADNVERYAIIRKIGADEKIINRALFRQIAIFFMFPMALAILHSYVVLKFASILIINFGSMSSPKGVLAASSIIVLIYGLYFLIAYIGSKNIIKDKR